MASGPVFNASPSIHSEHVVLASVESEKTGEEYDDEDYELDDIYVRTKFFESWLWTDVKLPGAPEADG